MATPGQLLGIDLKLGHNHFNIGIGFGSGHQDHEPSEINGGYQSNPEFISVDADAWCRFRVRADGATTSANTKYPRSELREYVENNTTKAAFNGGSGLHYMEGTSRIVHLPEAKPWVCFFQLHDASDDVCRIQTQGTNTGNMSVVAHTTPPGGGTEVSTTIKSSIKIGEVIAWRIEVNAGAGKVFLNGVQVLTFNGNGTGMYFKAGCYMQANETQVSASEYGAVDIKAGSLKHSHPGWTAPTSYWTDTSGGGSGSPTPTSSIWMGWGSCINAADSDAFSRIAALDPSVVDLKYFYLAGDCWYKDGATPAWVSDWNAKFGASNFASLISKLPATGLIVNWSDHDSGYLGNFCGNNGSVAASANAAYRSKFGSSGNGVQGATLPANGIYRSWVDGRVRFILLDERTFKSPNTATDNSSKVMLGATQEAWLKGLLANPGTPIVIVMGDVPWVDTALAGEDSYRGYNTERVRLGGYYGSSPATIIRLAGDMHCLAWAHDAYGIDRVWQAAGLNQASKVKNKGAGWGATFPVNGSSLETTTLRQIGLVGIVDDGQTITVAFGGYSSASANQVISDSIKVNAPSSGTGTGTVTAPADTGPPTIPQGAVASHPTGGPFTPPYPDNPQPGDMILTHIYSRYGRVVTCSDQRTVQLHDAAGGGTNSGNMYIFGHRFEVGDTAPSYTSSADDGGLMGKCTNWFGWTPEQARSAKATARPVIAPSMRPTQPKSLVAYWFGQDNKYALSNPTGGAKLVYAHTAISGPNSAEGSALGLAFEYLPQADPSGTCQVTSTGTGTPERWLAITMILDPVTAPLTLGTADFGVDINASHAALDLAVAKAEGVDFVVAQIGSGAGQTTHPDGSVVDIPSALDPKWSTFLGAAVANGLPICGVWTIGNSEPPAAQAARCAAAIVTAGTPIALDWTDGCGSYTNLDACVRAFRAAGLHVVFVRSSGTTWFRQGTPNLSQLNIKKMDLSGAVLNDQPGTLASLYGPVAATPAVFLQNWGSLTTTLLRYSTLAIVAGIAGIGAMAYPGDDLAGLLSVATVPDYTPPVPPSVGPGTSERDAAQGLTIEKLEYEFHFSDLVTGEPLGELPMKDVKCSMVIGGEAGALTGLINVADPRVRSLNPWAIVQPRRTKLHVRRIETWPAGTIAPREKVIWAGIVWDVIPKLGTGHLEIHAATFESYYATRYMDRDLTFSQVEQTDIHSRLLVSFELTRPGGDIQVAAASIVTGQPRDRTYLAKDNHNILTAAQQLARVQGGFDWWIEGFRDGISGRFAQRVVYGYPRAGRLASAPAGALKLRHTTDGVGSNLIAAPSITQQGTLVKNEIIAIGATTGDEALRVVVTAEDLDRQEITAGFPLIQGVYSDTSVTDPDTLRTNAAAKLREGWASELLLTGVALEGTKHPTLHDINLGDDTELYTDDATFQQPVTLPGRIVAIGVDCQEGDKAETVNLTIGLDT